MTVRRIGGVNVPTKCVANIHVGATQSILILQLLKHLTKKDMDKDKNLYRKVGRKYQPIGVLDTHWWNDGIYLVQHKGTSVTSMPWLEKCFGITRVGDVPKADFVKLAKMEQYTDAVSDVLAKYGIPPRGVPLQDMAREIIRAMHEVNERQGRK